MTDREVSVVLPAYNEAGTIEHTVSITLDALADFLPPGSFEVIVAEESEQGVAVERLEAALVVVQRRPEHQPHERVVAG